MPAVVTEEPSPFQDRLPPSKNRQTRAVEKISTAVSAAPLPVSDVAVMPPPTDNTMRTGEQNTSQDAVMPGDMDLDAFCRTVYEQRDRELPVPPRAVLRRIPEVMDDFIRNFLVRNGMHGTLENFEVEWYEKFGTRASHHTPLLPDNYLETAELLNRIEVLEHDLRQHAELTTKATKQWTQARKDRDFHRASHNRVVQEKRKLAQLLKQANHHAEDIDPTLVELRQRCEALFKAKSLLTLERDKLEQKLAAAERRADELEAQLQRYVCPEGGDVDGPTSGGVTGSDERKRVSKKKPMAPARPSGGGGRGASKAPLRRGGNSGDGPAEPTRDGFTWPADERQANTSDDVGASRMPPTNPSTWTNQSVFTAHSMSITKVAMHPRKPAVASCSDDGTWRLSALPQGDLIVSGEGHKNWVSCIAMHPRGTKLATGSGDTTVKLWDFASNSCAGTLSGHTDGVWSLDFQETGLLVASGSLDQTARVWDVEYGKCRQTLRGHVDAVNSVAWQPYTNILFTGSGDKTVSTWDCRMNCCAQSFYGHRNAVLSITPIPGGELLASCDAEGVVMVWDIRRIEQRLKVACGPHPANHVSANHNGTFLAVSSDDATIKLINLAEEVVSELVGHEEAVQCAVFDAATHRFLVSCGSDRTIRYWC